MEDRKGALVIVGAQHGDEGKGKISAFCVAREQAKMLCRAGVGPNAEHGCFFCEDGEYIKTNQLPLGFMRSADVQIRIGSGTCVDPRKLFNEMTLFNLEDRVKVDKRCPIVEPEHIEWERENLKGRSTYNGCGVCRSQFVLRKARQARDLPVLAPFLTDVPREINDMASKSNVVIESSQGTLLSLALSDDYPDVTSDNVTATAAMDDVGVNWRKVKGVVLVVKTMPTRESLGPMTTDEMSEEEIISKGLVEYSSIGGAVRRKSREINMELLSYAAEINGATEIALTFCDHFDPNMKNVTDPAKITKKVWDLVEKIEGATNVPVTIIETGKVLDSIIDVRDRYLRK